MTAVEQATVAFWSHPDPVVRRDGLVGPHWEDEAVQRDADCLFGAGLPTAASKAKRALEIGCGGGRLLVEASRRFGSVVGLDLSQPMLQDCWGRIDRAGQQNCWALMVRPPDWRFPLPDDCLDVVYSFLVFQHLQDRATILQYLGESFRVLRAGGSIRIQSHRGVPKSSTTFGGMVGHQYGNSMEFSREFEATGFRVVERLDGFSHPDWQWVTAIKP